ncbi:MAG: MarC family protein [Acidiferrobacterales bacterium]
MELFFKSALLLFVLLNPFLMSVYLVELIKGMPFKGFSDQLIRAGVISYVVFLLFAWAGEAVFEDVLQVRFLSFMIFGGITFLIIGVRMILGIGAPVESLRPYKKEVSGAIAMPFIVGPGTITASVLTGSRMELGLAAGALALGLVMAIVAILVVKRIYDIAQNRKEEYVSRYMDIAGRVTALFTGTFAIELILKGIDRWLALQ